MKVKKYIHWKLVIIIKNICFSIYNQRITIIFSNRKRLQIAAFFFFSSMTTYVSRDVLPLPAQRAASLIICHTCFEEVLLFTQVHHFRHPLEWVVPPANCSRQAQLC